MSPGKPVSSLRRTLGLACLAATAAIIAFVIWAVHFRDRRPEPTATANPPTSSDPESSSRATSSPPAYVPPAVTDPALTKFVDRRAPIGDRVKPDQPRTTRVWGLGSGV